MESNRTKLSLIFLVSVILSIVISFRDIILCAYLYNIYGYERIHQVINDTIALYFYSFVLVLALMWINFVWSEKYGKWKLLLFSFLVTAILCCLVSFIVQQDFPKEYFNIAGPGHHHEFEHNQNIIPLGLKSLIILGLIYTGGLIYSLYLKKINAERNLEKIRAESLQSRLTALNSQINPHFFFNALNSLYSLINEGKKEDSLEYLTNLSNVFRYILQSGTKKMVSLKEELEFLNKYKYMMAVKYGDKLHINADIQDKYLLYELPVLAILPVVENVVKHNEISCRNPMSVYLNVEDDNLVIKNKIQPKIDPVPSEGIGLGNLNNRYGILTGRQIKIAGCENEYIVLLPLIPAG